MIAFLESLHRISNFLHITDKLVTHHEVRAARLVSSEYVELAVSVLRKILNPSRYKGVVAVLGA